MPRAGVLVLPMPERSPPCLTQNPLVGSSWDYKIRRTWSAAPQTECYLVPQAGQKQRAGQGELPRLPAAAVPCSTQLPQLNLNTTLCPLGPTAQLTFLGQHGDEGTDELVVVVGSPLVIDLQRDDKSTSNPQMGGREKGELKANRAKNWHARHSPQAKKTRAERNPPPKPVHNWDYLHPSSDASIFHKGQLGRGKGGQGRNPARPWGRDSPLPPVSADAQLWPSCSTPSPSSS